MALYRMSNHFEIAYHASHEQFTPSSLLQYVQLAEQAGFDAIHSSDHFHPWSERQGQSGFSFTWIGAAMQVTSLPFSLICAPGQRYHPAIVAQAIATICQMFPGRFIAEFGSGEAINEYMSHGYWPDKPVRNARLEQAAMVIRKLLSGETVSHGAHFEVHEAKLYTLPEIKPFLFGAALTKETAEWCAGWADGLLTSVSNREDALEKIHAFRDKAGKDLPVHAQFSFSYHPSYAIALQEAHHQWRSNMVGKKDLADLNSPKEFDRKTEAITMREFSARFPVYTSMRALLEKAREFAEAGVNRIILHNVNKQQETFIDDFGKA